MKNRIFLYYSNLILIIVGNILLFILEYFKTYFDLIPEFISITIFFFILLPTFLSIYISLFQIMYGFIMLFLKKWNISLHNIFSGILGVVIFMVISKYTLIGVLMKQ